MRYEYESDDGSRLERDLPMSEAPPVGSEYVHDGKVYRRVPSVPGVAGGFPARGIVSYTMDPKEALRLGGTVNSDGYVCFEGKAKQDEFVSRTQDTHNPVVNVR